MRIVHSMPPTRLVTADELERMPEDDFRYELVEGRLIRMSPVGTLHGAVTARLLAMLVQHAKVHDVGLVVTEVGFKLSSQPDTVRAPDIAVVARERMPAGRIPRGFWSGPPDLAVEVLSPEDRRTEIAAKVNGYLASGVRLVWIVDPDERTVTAHHRLRAPVTFGSDDTLDALDVVPGFTCPLRELFD
jgi:Uma2 family endonuclease